MSCLRSEVNFRDGRRRGIIVGLVLGLVGLMTVDSLRAQQPIRPIPELPAKRYKERPGRSLLMSKHEREYQRAFSRIISHAQKQAKRWDGKDARNKSIVDSLNRIYTNTTFLQDRWADWLKKNKDGYQKNVRDHYLAALNLNGDLMGDLKRSTGREKTAAVLKSVADDLQAKADHCRKSKDGLGRTVTVQIRTQSDKAEADQGRVWYVPRGLLSVVSRHIPISSKERPVTQKMPPGVYAFWVQTQTAKADPLTVTVGGTGETTMVIDLDLP